MSSTLITPNLIDPKPTYAKIAEFDVSIGTSVELLNVFDADNALYFLKVDDIQLDTNGAGLQIQLGNAPSTWLTSGWKGIWEFADSAVGYIASTNTNASGLDTVHHDSTGEGATAQTWIRNPMSTTRMQSMRGFVVGNDATVGSYAQQSDATIFRTAGTSYNSCRLILSTGGITHLSGALYKF